MTGLYDFTVPAFSRGLGSLKRVLAIGRAFCDTTRLDPAIALATRLAPDMYPLSYQVGIACDIARRSAVRLGGCIDIDLDTTVPEQQRTFYELFLRIDRSLTFLEAVPRDRIDGTEAVDVVLQSPLWGERRFAGLDYVRLFALPNFYFHVTTAYDILRHLGAPLGKQDYLGGG